MGDWNFENPPECIPDWYDLFYGNDEALSAELCANALHAEPSISVDIDGLSSMPSFHDIHGISREEELSIKLSGTEREKEMTDMTATEHKSLEYQYSVEYSNMFEQPYDYSGNDKAQCLHETTEEWKTNSLETLKNILRDMLDVPYAPLTIENVHKDFDRGPSEPISDRAADAIMTYYNGRLETYNKAIADIDKLACDGYRHTLHYYLPGHYNTFFIEDADDFHVKQLNAYIKIVIGASSK